MLTKATGTGSKISLAIFCLIIWASGVSAAVTFDSSGSGAAFSNTGVGSLSWQHTVTVGTDRALFVAVSTTADPLLPGLPVCVITPQVCNNSLPGTSSARVLSITYNGDSMQSIGFQVSADLKQSVELFRLAAPDQGMPYNVVVTLNPASVFQVVGGSNSFNGVSQTTPNGNFNSAAGVSNLPMLAVGDAVVGDAVLDALAVPPNALNAVVGANQTELYNGRSFFNNSYDLGAGSVEPGAGGAETMSWTTTSSSNWALAAVAVKQSVVSAANVAVEGRVLNRSGRGIARARITLTDFNGVVRTASTNFFGYFRFQNVASGTNYIFSVSTKKHTFSPQVIAVNEDLTGLNFVSDQ